MSKIIPFPQKKKQLEKESAGIEQADNLKNEQMLLLKTAAEMNKPIALELKSTKKELELTKNENVTVQKRLKDVYFGLLPLIIIGIIVFLLEKFGAPPVFKETCIGTGVLFGAMGLLVSWWRAKPSWRRAIIVYLSMAAIYLAYSAASRG